MRCGTRSATTIRVTLRDDEDVLLLVVEDDGIGFDREAVAQRAKRGEHLGLLGMTERARSAGGTHRPRLPSGQRQPHRGAHSLGPHGGRPS